MSQPPPPTDATERIDTPPPVPAADSAGTSRDEPKGRWRTWQVAVATALGLVIGIAAAGGGDGADATLAGDDASGDELASLQAQVEQLEAELGDRDELLAAQESVAADEAAPEAEPAPAPEVDPEPDAEPEPQPAAEPELTVAQDNALRSAENYLGFSAFSRSGLIDQLEFEGFSTEDATLAVDTVDVDWDEQAAKSAENYLDYSAFSRSGLIEQLKFEGFTAEQAEYGVNQTGL